LPPIAFCIVFFINFRKYEKELALLSKIENFDFFFALPLPILFSLVKILLKQIKKTSYES